MIISRTPWSERSAELVARLVGTAVEDIAKYLQICSNLHVSNAPRGPGERAYWPYPSPEAIVLSHGRSMTLGPYPKRLPRGTPRACFANAMELASRYPRRFTYCEGWGLPGFLPQISALAIHHAWVIDRKSQLVVDPTWDENEVSSVYFGIPVKRAWAEQALRSSGSVLYDYARQHPILMGGVSVHQWLERSDVEEPQLEMAPSQPKEP